jgi:hypothetical protein
VQRVVSAGAVALDGGQSQALIANTASFLVVADGKPRTTRFYPTKFDDLLIYLSRLQVSSMILV